MRENYLSQLYEKLVLGHPKLVLILLIFLFGFFSYHTKDFALDASADSLLLEGDENLQLFRQTQDRYPSGDLLIITYTPLRDLFSNYSLDRIKTLRNRLRKFDGIRNITTILDVPLIKSSDQSLTEMVTNVPKLENSDINPKLAKKELLNSKIYRNLIISEDGRSTALLLELTEDINYSKLLKQRNDLRQKERNSKLSDKENIQLKTVSKLFDLVHKQHLSNRHLLLKNVRETINSFKSEGSLFLGGLPLIVDDMIGFIRSDLIVFGLGVFLFLVIVLTILFRQLRWIILPLVNCLFSGLLMIGFLGLIGWKITVISSNFLALMLIITISMNIHLIVRYRQLEGDYPNSDNEWLVKETCYKMAKPCLYTTLTSIIGFGSLVVSDIKPVIDFGWMMSTGLSVTFLITFLLFPILLLLLGKSTSNQKPSHYLTFLPKYFANLTQLHGAKVLLIASLVGVIAIYGITKLQVENSFVNYFGKNTEIYKGLKEIDTKFGGTTPLEILIKFESDIDTGLSEEDMREMTKEEIEFEKELAREKSKSPKYWFTTDKIDQIKEVHDFVHNLPQVGKVLSLASSVRVAEDFAEEKLDSMELALLYTKIPEDIRATLIDPYVSIVNNEARIIARIVDTKPNLRRNQLLQEIEEKMINVMKFDKDEFKITGLLVLYNNMLQSLFSSQIKSLGVVMLGIGVMFLLLFRSITLSIIGIIPNLLGALVVLGIMGLANIPMDMMTITIAAITIGIAVDNGIHYLYRFREEYKNNEDYSKSLELCHFSAGRAIFYTTITIIFGFSILVLSNFVPSTYFGILTAISMLIGLLASLTVLPKLILMYKPFST